MVVLFLVLWTIFICLNTFGAKQAKVDKKLSNAFFAFIIAPLSVLGYIIQPILISLIADKTLLSLSLLLVIAFFAFGNLRFARYLRGL